jgi:signal peptidase II
MQAARGTSLSPSHVEPDSGHSRRRSTWWLFALIGVAAYALDVSTKQWALATLEDRDIEVVVTSSSCTDSQSRGRVSTGAEFTVVLSCLAVVAVCIVLALSVRLASPLWSVGLGLLLGGVGATSPTGSFVTPG